MWGDLDPIMIDRGKNQDQEERWEWSQAEGQSGISRSPFPLFTDGEVGAGLSGGGLGFS